MTRLPLEPARKKLQLPTFRRINISLDYHKSVGFSEITVNCNFAATEAVARLILVLVAAPNFSEILNRHT